MGLLFNQQPSDERITAYANALMNYEPNQIIFAFKKVINSGTAFFPSLAEILKHLRPAEEVGQDKAPQIVAEMLQALRWYGPHDETNMLQNVSPEARLTFQKLGHTADIRNSENIDTIRAQLERLARSVLSSRETGKKNQELERIGIVLPLKKPSLQALDYSDFGIPNE
jgi:hypothetical protein